MWIIEIDLFGNGRWCEIASRKRFQSKAEAENCIFAIAGSPFFDPKYRVLDLNGYH